MAEHLPACGSFPPRSVRRRGDATPQFILLQGIPCWRASIATVVSPTVVDCYKRGGADTGEPSN